MRVNLANNMVQYLDANNVWQDWTSISPQVVTNTLPLPLSSNNGDGYSITSNAGHTANAYAWFNDGSTKNIQGGTFVNCLFTSPRLIKQLRARIGNVERGTIKFRVTYDGTNWVNVGSNLISGGVQESAFVDNTLQLNATIYGFGLTCTPPSGSTTNMNFGSLGAYE